MARCSECASCSEAAMCSQKTSTVWIRRGSSMVPRVMVTCWCWGTTDGMVAFESMVSSTQYRHSNDSARLDIEFIEHRGDRFVQLLAPPNLLETVEKVLRAEPLFFRAANVVQHAAAMHHHDAVAESNGLL